MVMVSSQGSTIYLISGTNRGIGLGLVAALAQRPNVKVYAGARDPSKATALNELAAKSNGNVHVVQLSSTSVEDARAVAQTITVNEGKLDVVVANAGIAESFASLADTPAHELDNHFNVNTKGVLILYQATHSLLSQSSSPKFALISSIAGSLGIQAKHASYTTGAYGASKAAANFLIARMHGEQPKWVVIAFQPGHVQTDMGNAASEAFGVEMLPTTIEESANGVIKGHRRR